MVIGFFLTAFLLGALLYGRVPFWVLIMICVALPLLLTVLHKTKSGVRGSILYLDVLAQNSRLLSWNTGLKVCVSVGILVFCLIANSFLVATVVALGMMGVTLATGRIRLSEYFSLLTVPLVFIVLSSLVLLVDVSPTPLGLLDIPFFNGFLCVTEAAQVKTALVVVKAIGALCCLYALSLSTPLYEIISFLRRMKTPSIVLELMVLIYRYIFILMEALQNMKTAAQARLGYRTYRNAWRSFVGIGTNLLAQSFLRARRSFDAMEARCYEGEVRFLERTKPLTSLQIMGAVGVALLPSVTFLVERGIM